MTTRDYELMAWLGDAADEMSDEELDLFETAAAEIAELLPDRDDADEREQLMTSAHLAITHDIDLEQAAIGRMALRWLTVSEVRDGISEVQAAQRAGVDRMTVRRWLGKL